jgi:citronellol/citronellal dehydrogenase
LSVAYRSALFAPGLFDGQVALVTGGGSGIGLAVARELGALGARLVIAGRSRERLDAGAAVLGADGFEVLAETADIREPDQVGRLVDAAIARFGRIDVLVNNAGGQFPKPAEQLSPRGFEAVVRNNLNGTFNMTLLVAQKAMIPARRGRVVNVIANVFRGFPGMAHTGAARAGVENLTKSLAVEWARHGIKVNAVAPGTIRSSGTAQYGDEMLESSRQATPLKRLGTPEEVSRVVVFLASHLNDYVTGSTYYIDGGLSLWGDIWPIEEPATIPEPPGPRQDEPASPRQG